MEHRGLRLPHKADHRVCTSTSAPSEAAAMPTVLSKPQLTAPLRADDSNSPKQQCAGDLQELKRLKTLPYNDATSRAKEVHMTSGMLCEAHRTCHLLSQVFETLQNMKKRQRSWTMALELNLLCQHWARKIGCGVLYSI